MDLSASLRALTGSLQDNGLGASLRGPTSGFVGLLGPTATIAASLEALTGTLSSRGNVDGSMAATLPRLSSAFKFPSTLAAQLSQATASLTGTPGPIGSLAGTAAQLAIVLTGSTTIQGALSAQLRPLTIALVPLQVVTGSLASAARGLRGAFSGNVGAVGSVSASLATLRAAVLGSSPLSGDLAIQVPRLLAYFTGDLAIGADLNTWAMNTRTNAVTSYPSLQANSFARYNGVYLAAGPNGLILLDSGDDVESAWRVRTGALDDKKTALKRLTEVLLGTRYDGAVRIRIWKDESTYYDYTLPNLKPSTLQQVRAKIGKGLRSRYFKVELSGASGRFELDSLQATMPVMTRRIG